MNPPSLARPGTWHYRRSLASRITVLTTLAVALAVTAVAFAAYATIRAQSQHALDESLRSRALAAEQRDTLDALASDSIPSWALGAADVKIIFVNAQTHTAHSADNTSTFRIGQPEFDVALGKRPWSARTVSAQGEEFRMVTVPGSSGEALTLAQSLAPTNRMLERLGLVMVLIGLVGVFCAALAGWAVARHGLRPVRRLTGAVEDIARTQQLEPIPVEGNDEVARLSVRFNAMLAALSVSQHLQRQLVADAGHELRTPLTSLRTNLDLLVQADRGEGLSHQSREELLDDVRAQINEMTTLIGDIVELAREDPTGDSGQPVEPVELGAVVAQAVARVRRRNSSLKFDVRTTPWWVIGESGGLERAITNLLDNAAKWSPAGGTVEVTLTEGTLLVTDQGRGISEPDLPKVFDRFYRSAESRAMPGSGLGLSIVRAVAERHGGLVQAGRAPSGGAAFWFSVPGTAAPPEVLAGS